mgnify:FL=1
MGWKFFITKMVEFMLKSIYNKQKAGKIRIKMRSQIHVVLLRDSEFHSYKMMVLLVLMIGQWNH